MIAILPSVILVTSWLNGVIDQAFIVSDIDGRIYRHSENCQDE